MRRTMIACLLLLMATAVWSQETPKHEIRAVWLTTLGGLDWPRTTNPTKQKEDLIRILDQYKAAGINTVLFQTRVRASTIYPSAIEPWTEYLTGKVGRSPGYDPLQMAIDECHKRGMQLHAWVVTIPVGKWKQGATQLLRKKRPRQIVHIGDEGFMNPEMPETAEYIAKCCREIVDNYDVDGIHLDYIRYPETWGKRSKTTPDERRANITRIVKAIHREVKALKPWVMLSCSPVGKYDNLSRYPSGGWNARHAVFQEAQEWLKEGLMDALFPMMYFRNNHFYPFAIDWQERSYGRFIVPGLGIYFLDPREGKWELKDVEREMYVSRQLGIGHCYFRSKFLTDNVKGIYDFAKRFDETPSLIPPMTWAQAAAPDAVENLSLKKGVLSWTDQYLSDKKHDYHLYNIYASEDFPVDITKADNLVATRLMTTSVAVPDSRKMNYAVTCQDRYGLESQPAQLLINAGRLHTTQQIATTDGRPIRLPEKPITLDADYVVIESMQGQQLAVASYKQPLLDVSHLPDGIYQLRSLGRKARSHRIGFFIVKRK